MPFCGPPFLNTGKKIVLGWIAVLFILSLFPAFSHAIPAFARKHDLSCTSCHTKPPRLNAFGEAFHMAGFQIPMTEEGEIKEKRKIGRIWSELDFLNIFSLRAQGNFVESFNGGEITETNLTLPQEVELYLAGTVTNSVSFFFELENETKEIEGNNQGGFGETSRFGLGKEFFVMFDLHPLIQKMGSGQEENGHGSMGGPMFMGPMIMAGKIDPSTNFSYPTNRQFILNVPGKADSGSIQRFSLTPFAFASKFFGMRSSGGEAVEVTEEVLYNTTGDFGLDVHAMLNGTMVQAGLMQGLSSGTTDVNQKKDPYFMIRKNFGRDRFISGSLSGLVYWGNDTGRVPVVPGSTSTVLIDWLRYGFAGNVKYKSFDIYGAFIWDDIQDLPGSIGASFDDEAFGFTLEADYLASDQVLFSGRYDHLDSGGFISQKANAKVITLQGRYYLRDNFSMYLRDSINVENDSTNPLQSYRNLVAVGLDFDF
ncbi:MAG TPA: hypothetical protein VGB26_00725 [Nitrospiria bacterium]